MSVNAPRRQLSLFDSMCIIAGIVIGAGIYEVTPMIAGQASSHWMLLAIWVTGGLISLTGAMCYAELTTAYPQDGGDYVYITRAFGSRAGLLFAWMESWIVRPGNLGMMAFVFARFANQLYPIGSLAFLRTLAKQAGSPDALGFLLYASGSIVILTALNVLGVRSGKWTQNVLTVIKVVGLLAIFVVGFFLLPAAKPPTEAATPSTPDFRLGLILVLFTYGGWNDLSYVAAEVRNPSRNLFRALTLGVGVITLIYVLVNLAFVRALGLEGTAKPTVAADLLTQYCGPRGGQAISLLICCSCLGAINGTLLAGSRIYYVVGAEHRVLSWLGKWSGKFDGPVRALILQTLVAVLWIILFGNEKGFSRLVIFTAPVYWFFAMMVGMSLFILRWRDPDVPRPHKVWGYPWLPVVFCLSCGFMFDSGFVYALSKWRTPDGWALEAIALLIVLAAGIAVMQMAGHEDRPAE